MPADPELLRRLVAHLQSWLGSWPPARPVDIVASPKRDEPGWDGRIHDVIGVSAVDATVISVPPRFAEAARAAGDDLASVKVALPAAVGRPGGFVFEGRFRWCHELIATDEPGEWVRRDDPRVPDWLKPFNGDVLVFWDDDGAYGGGVGRKIHDEFGHELSVGTEPHLRGRGIARRLVAQAARRVADDGAVATYLHAFDNLASAKVAESSGFPDVGWRVLGVASPG